MTVSWSLVVIMQKYLTLEWCDGPIRINYSGELLKKKKKDQLLKFFLIIIIIIRRFFYSSHKQLYRI